jgi:hypothetical protein
MERNSAVALRRSSLIDERREAKDAAMGRKGSFCGKRVVPAVLWAKTVRRVLWMGRRCGGAALG